MDKTRHEGAGGSLVLRLVRSAILWALPILIAAAVAMTLFYRSSTYRIFDDPIVSAVMSLIASAEIEPDATSVKQLTLARELTDPRYQQALSGRYWMFGQLNIDGTISPIKASRSLVEQTLTLPLRDVQTLIDSPGEEVVTHAVGPDGEPLRVAARYIIFPGLESQAVFVLAAADSRPATAAVGRFALLATVLMALLSMGLVTAVFTQVRVGLKPLFDLRDRVVAVREGRVDRVDGIYPREIQPLATELNSLIEHNRDIVDRAQTHVSNLAHALKTPIAVLKNESAADAGSGGQSSPLAEIVIRQTGIMHNQVEHHLNRARAAARGKSIGVSADVTEALGSLARTLPRIYRSKDIDLVLNIEGDAAGNLYFRGERRDLDDMVGNLMDNACKWCAGVVSVRAYILVPDDGLLAITVEDDGAGLEPQDYAQALKRGERLDEATPGTGFGLSIVDDLARAYKGTLSMSRSELGGLKATLTLPRRLGSPS